MEQPSADRNNHKHDEQKVENVSKELNQNTAKVTSYGKVKLLNRLSINELKAIHKRFPVAMLGTIEDEPKRNVEQFCDLLSSILTEGNKAEFQELFDIIDTDKEGFVDWDKFCSHMQRDYQEKDDRMKTTQVPQWRELKYITSLHKESIQRITMLINPSRYITLSKEGVIVVWNLSMKPMRTIYVTTEPEEVKQRDLWITDFTTMQNIYKLALALTSKEIAIYDLSSKSEFLCQYRIRGLKSTPISLNFWADPEKPNESILVFGDVSGKVNALIFCASTISLFDRPAQSNTSQQDITSIVELSDIAKGHYKNCRYVYHHGHTEWTRQVMYTSLLDCFISCATNYKNALVLGWMEKTRSNMRTNTFKISQGVNAFDYNEKMNLIATAGVNHHVLLWNPYVISKPVGVLRGHMQSVVSVKFIQSRGQTISLSKDKVLRIWDTHLQVCLQRLSGIFPKGPEVSTVMYFDEERSTLLTAFNHRLSVMVMKPEVKDRIISHEHPVVGAIYNRKFNQVISACVGSVVTMWMVDTGQKVKQFTNAHGNSEITTITQDASETRLFTGSTDGTVKIWDFNGHCHHVLVAGDGHPCDITEVLPLKRMILVVGWDRMLCVFRDSQLTSYYVHPSDWKGRQEHQDDIQCMAFSAPHTLVSASYDGELVLWNTSSEQASRHFGCRARKTARTNRRLRKLEQSGSALSRSRDERLAAPSLSDIIRDDVSTISANLDDSQDENEADVGYFVNKLIFLDHRLGLAKSDGANLVSCGASGWVRFWNTNHNICVGEFIAHDHAGAITMAVDQFCHYLATGDGDGLVKVWNISEFCTEMSEEPPVTKIPPLYKQFQPHLDSITSIEIFERFDRLLLLTSSTDCSVAVWDIHGRQLGVFGQEEHWKIEDIPTEQPQSDDEEAEDHEDNVNSQGERRHEDASNEDHSGSTINISKEPFDAESRVSTWDHSILGKAYSEPRKQKRQRRQPQTKLSHVHQHSQEKNAHLSMGTYSTLDTKELTSVGALNKPDFINNPDKYFHNNRPDTSELPKVTVVPPICETISMRYDEKNLFPRHILEMEAKMKATHAIALRGSRANTRAAASTRGKPSPALEGHKTQHIKPQNKRINASRQNRTSSTTDHDHNFGTNHVHKT